MFNYKNFILMLGLLLLIVSCILIDNKVYAQTGTATPQLIGKVRLSWNPPTQREDGTPFLPSEVGYYLLQLNDKPVETINEDNVEKYLLYGKYSYTVILVDTNGLCSAPSTVKKLTVKTPPKKPLYPSVKLL